MASTTPIDAPAIPTSAPRTSRRRSATPLRGRQSGTALPAPSSALLLRDVDVDAAVALPPLVGVVARHGELLAVAFRGEPAREAVAPTTTLAPRPAPTTTLAPRPAPTTTLAPAAAPAAGLIKRNLTCGQELEFAPNGIEAGLIAFIDDKTSVIDGKKWFSFDRLEFETDSATLKPSSRAQLRNIADILKCYSNVDLKIGGYTDNTGDKAYNLKLSQERARNTMNELVAGGVAASRLSAEGYGEQFPVASNDTDEGRQRNRRIDVNITKK